MDAVFLQAHITATKALIVAYETAIEAIVVKQLQSYTLDTGQTVTTVTRINLSRTQEALDSLYNRCAMFEARLNGTNVQLVRPAF